MRVPAFWMPFGFAGALLLWASLRSGPVPAQPFQQTRKFLRELYVSTTLAVGLAAFVYRGVLGDLRGWVAAAALFVGVVTGVVGLVLAQHGLPRGDSLRKPAWAALVVAVFGAVVGVAGGALKSSGDLVVASTYVLGVAWAALWADRENRDRTAAWLTATAVVLAAVNGTLLLARLSPSADESALATAVKFPLVMAAFCGAGLLVSGALVVYGSGRGALYGGIGTMTAVAYFSAVTIWPDEGLPLSRVPTDGGVLQDMHVFASLATGLWGGPIAEFVAARIGGSSRTIQGLRALVTIAILAATTRVGGVYGLALAAVGAGATTLLATVGDFSALQCRALGRILMPVATVTVLAATFVPGAADISDGRFVAGALTGAVLAELVRRAHRLGPMRFSIMWLGTPMALWGLLGAPAVVGSVLGVWLDASMQAEVDDGLDLSLWWSMLALAMAPLFL